MKRIDVRCCCRPKKLLGTVPVPDAHGDRHTFSLMQPRVHDFTAARLKVGAGTSPRSITLPIDSFVDMSGCHPKYGLAVKAEGVAIETLRLIPGFIEHKP